jgi:ubiquinone/menaquinone biosynthesis C-methylase UbiE
MGAGVEDSVREPNAPDELSATRRYYDAFAERYEARRGGRIPGGYHDMLDDLELGFLRRYAEGREVLEVGCGTGLLLERIAGFASRAVGIDLSPGMLELARERGLEVVEGSATNLPFADESFDVACSFKVLAHVPDLDKALSEMLRVIRPGGIVVAELYNRRSLRALVKRYGPAGAVSKELKEDAVYTRFDDPAEVAANLPAGARLEAERGVRIVTPAAKALELPVVGPALRATEERLADGRLARLGGFWIAAIRKTG